MYFLRLKPLKEELVAGRLPGGQRFAYLLAWTILWVLLPFFGLPSSTTLKLVLFLGCLIIAIFGIRYVHRRNGGADGPALLDRFASIGWVVTLRVILVVNFIGVLVALVPPLRSIAATVSYWVTGAVGFFAPAADLDSGFLEGWNVLIEFIAWVYMLRAIGRHIGDVHEAADGVEDSARRRTGVVPDALTLQTPALPAQRAQGGVLMTPAGLDGNTSQQLERFVETVVQRELATGGTATGMRKRPSHLRPAAPRRKRTPHRRPGKRR